MAFVCSGREKEMPVTLAMPQADSDGTFHKPSQMLHGHALRVMGPTSWGQGKLV